MTNINNKSTLHFNGQFKINLKSSNDITGLCELSKTCKKYEDRFKSVRIYTENPTKGLKFDDGACCFASQYKCRPISICIT